MTGISQSPLLIGQGIESIANQQPESNERIRELAQEFEGVFLSLLTKELRKTVNEGGLFGQESTDSFGGLFDLYMGQHLAKAQPLGIASLWVNQYEQNNATATNTQSSNSTTA